MDYYLYFDTHVALPRLQQLLTWKGPVQGAWIKKVNPMGVYSHFGQAEGAMIELQQLLEVNPFGQTVKRQFLMDPCVKFNLKVDELSYNKDGNYTGIETVLAALTTILSEAPGDALMLSPEDEIVLRRQSGKILLNPDCKFWNPARLSLLNLPYDLQPAERISWS